MAAEGSRCEKSYDVGMLEDLIAKHHREQDELNSQAKSLESEIRKNLSRSLIVLEEYSRESGWGRLDRLGSHYPFGAGESEPVTALIVDLSPPAKMIYSALYVRFAAWFEPKFLSRGMALKCKV